MLVDAMSHLPQLISIYAARPIADVAANPAILETAFGQSLDALALLPGFAADQEFVREQKSLIEASLPRLDTADRSQQIGQCLRELLQLAIYDDAPATTVMLKFDTVRDLLLAMYAANWNKDQREHFAFVAARLRGWRTYFLSYTNSGATIVNDKYKSIISRYVDPQTRQARSREQDNLLADAIIHELQRRRMNRRSFYDKRAIEPGDPLRSTIQPAATETLAFLQLIQLDIFTKPPAENWPFQEYQFFEGYNADLAADRQRYRQAFDTRYIAILAGKPEEVTLDDMATPPAYRLWKTRILQAAHFLELPASKQKFEAIITELQRAILSRAYRLIDMVP
jgi:hypothetical protein